MKRISLTIQSIVVATLAAAGCGEATSSVAPTGTTTTTTTDGGADAATDSGALLTFPAFPDQGTFACEAPLAAVLDDLHPAEPFDSLALRSEWVTHILADGGEAVEPYQSTARGTPCAHATNSATCLAAVRVAEAGGVGWLAPRRGEVARDLRTYAVYTRGDTVGRLTTRAEVAAFLGAIDTLGEARLVADADGRFPLSCEKPAASAIAVPDPGYRKNLDGSYEIVAVVSTCASISRERYVITASGAVTEVASSAVQEPGIVCGRRPAGLVDDGRSLADLGAHFAEVAWLEAAAVVAFRGLARDLRVLGAPGALVRRAEAAQADEIRHARDASALARRHGAADRRLEVAPWQERERFAIALENAVEGCVRETYGALVAAYQARAAEDPAARRFFASIAADEARHAELSHDVAVFLEAGLTPAERARIAEAKAAALAELYAAADAPPPGFAAAVGLPDVAAASRLLAGLDREILAAA